MRTTNRRRRQLLLVLAVAVVLAALVGFDRLLQRLDLPSNPAWPTYFAIIAMLPGDFELSGGGDEMANSPQDSGQTARVATEQARIVFLHHSTGHAIWVGTMSKASSNMLGKSAVRDWIADYNKRHGTNHQIEETNFPTTSEGYPWANYPYDYYNIWVKHAGDSAYQGEPTLEMLTQQYDVIVWKHCFPVASILPDTGNPDVNSGEKRLENYRLQYAALKEKMRSFPDTRFIVWTGAAPTVGQLRTAGPTRALRTRQFFDWVKSEWDEPGDNIFLWDFYGLETEGGIYMKTSYATGLRDPHPRPEFAGRVAPLFAQRIIDVVNGQGDSTPLTGRHD